MSVFRLLVLPLLISTCVAPVAAQSLSQENPVSQFLPAPPQDNQIGIRADQFRLHRDGFDRSHMLRPPEFRAPILRSDATCYSLRAYRVTRDDPESDVTKPAGYSTCQPAARFQLKDAGDLPVQASYP